VQRCNYGFDTAATNRRIAKTRRSDPLEVKIGEYSGQLKGKNHCKSFVALAPVLLLISVTTRSKSCFSISCDDALRFAGKRAGRISMRISGKTLVKSSHDLILIIGAVIAIAMIVSKMVHNWRNLPTSLGASNAAVMVADSSLAPH
jgi:hypothetical protein